MGMNPTLAAMYNTLGAGDAAREEQIKVAHLELFAKSAMAQGIDLSQYSDADRNQLFVEFTQKLAEEEGEEEEKEPPKKEGENGGGNGGLPPFMKKDEGEGEGEGEEKDAAARREHAARVEWQEKNAQVDFLGRRMAHALWDEYNNISKAAAAAASGQPIKPTAQAPAQAPAKTASVKSTVSAFDHQAATEAVKIAAGAGIDQNEVINRLNAVLTLGPKDTEKTAGIKDYNDSVSIRALELLEQAKYPVDWNQVFSK